jgi:D-sedoheptulose 7-phosphate isomerase
MTALIGAEGRSILVEGSGEVTGESNDARRTSVAVARDPAADQFRALATGYLADLTAQLERLDVDSLMRIVERLRVARDAGATVFTAGNGGSAATASHWVNDLGKATRRSGRRPFRVLGLADNISWFSALANDEGYERVFAGQLENLARPGDILAVISASGNSPNLVRAVEHARATGMTSIGFLGFDGGALLKLVDEAFWVPTPAGAYGLVESIHSVACDIVTSCLIDDRPAEPAADR